MWVNALTKKARVILGYGVDTSCINCSALSKMLAIGYTGENTQNFLYCITPNQTNNSLQIYSTGTHNTYQFDSNGLWLAADWQTQSTQYFTNFGYKTVGVYNIYQKCGCSGTYTSSLEFSTPRCQAAFVSDNGNTCTIQIQNQSDSLYATGVTGYKKVWQEINGAWSLLATATIPANVRGGTITNNANVTIPTSQSQVPLHFKVEIASVESLQYATMDFPLTVATYKIAGVNYTPTTTITAPNLSGLATALNADLLTQGTLPINVASSKFFAGGSNLVLSNNVYTGTLSDYNVVSTTPTTYLAISNFKSPQTYADMWLEVTYLPVTPPAPTPPAQEFIDYGKAYCKIRDYKCIGRFADVEDLQEIADQKLVNILATNDSFFTSLL